MGASSGRSFYFFGLTAFLVACRAPFLFAAANLFLVAAGARFFSFRPVDSFFATRFFSAMG
jgi:hypothetical protein